MSYKKIAVIVLSLMGFSWVHAVNSLAGMEAYVTIEGTTQGLITAGASPQINGHEDECVVASFGHSFSVLTDPQTGQSTGQRVHNPLRIVKPVDKATPLLNQALAKGERLSKVEIRFFRVGQEGTMEHFYTIKLEDAIIISMSPSFIPSAAQENQMLETASFNYRKITWTNVVDGTSAEDDWEVPR